MFVRDIAVDLGSAMVRMAVRGRGVVLREPALAARDRRRDMVLAMGQEAAELLTRAPGQAAAIRPIQDGVIADAAVAARMLRVFLKKVLGGSPFKPGLLLALPTHVTPVERQALIDAGMQAGAKRVSLLEMPRAAALGAGLPIQEPMGQMVVDMGYSSCHAAVLAMDSVQEGEARCLGGRQLDQAMTRRIRREYGLLLGAEAAADLRERFGRASGADAPACFPLRGRDLQSGVPRMLELTAEEIWAGYLPVLEEVLELVQQVLERVSPALRADLERSGITLTGGVGAMAGLSEFLSAGAGLPVRLAEAPEDCVIRGLAIAMREASLPAASAGRG